MKDYAKILCKDDHVQLELVDWRWLGFKFQFMLHTWNFELLTCFCKINHILDDGIFFWICNSIILSSWTFSPTKEHLHPHSLFEPLSMFITSNIGSVNYSSIPTHKHEKMDTTWANCQYGWPIKRQSFPSRRALYPEHLYKPKVSFLIFDGYTWPNI